MWLHDSMNGSIGGSISGRSNGRSWTSPFPEGPAGFMYLVRPRCSCFSFKPLRECFSRCTMPRLPTMLTTAFSSSKNEVTFGAFVRGLHHWGASAMVVAIGLHMLQTFLYGAYKPPREVMWMVGVVLFLMVMAFAFTGYLLPGIRPPIGRHRSGSIWWARPADRRIPDESHARRGECLGALTLSRFFAIHVLFPAGDPVVALDCRCISSSYAAWARPGHGPTQRASFGSETFYPRQVYMDAVVMLRRVCGHCAAGARDPFPLTDKADPSDTSFVPVPEWYFLFYYELLKYVHGPFEPLATWILPMLVILILLVWPFIDRNPARNPIRATRCTGCGRCVSHRGALTVRALDQESLCSSSNRSGSGERKCDLCPVWVCGLSSNSRRRRSGRAGFVLRRRRET